MNQPILLLLSTLALLSACSTPYHPPVFPDSDTRFPGLADVMASTSGRTADVLLVHGICTHDASWAPETVAQLTAALKANLPPAGASAAPLAAQPTVEIVPSTVSLAAGTLRFDTLIWSPLTTPLKRQLCYDQTNKSELCLNAPPFTPQRVRYNAVLKDGLLDDCLSDAVIYMGVAHEEMVAQMREAVLRATAGQDTATPLVVVAESMGSKLLFDTLLSMLDEPSASGAPQAAQQTLARMTYLVMAGNQIPLMALADQPLAGGQARTSSAHSASGQQPEQNNAAQPAPWDSLQRLLQRRQSLTQLPAAAARRPLVLIAFTDPNDLLSYTLLRARYAGEGIAVYNILVSNATTYLGLLERPDLAHTSYLLNPDVGRLIACGYPTSALCK